jgi:DNA-directed RNA polymerase subunit M/transcription elongation factor TFIIS
MLFCKPIKRRATAKELFKMVDDFVKQKSIKWSDCVGVCTVAARIMAKKKKELQALIKRSAPEARWTHCESCPELSEVMETMIKTVNYINTHPSKSSLSTELREEMGHNISHSWFTVTLVGCKEETLWFVFTTCEE